MPIFERMRPGKSGSAPAPSDSYTLVVPTYNRAGLLSRLLDYLERVAARFRVLILDSSAEETRRDNAARVSRSRLAIRHSTYSSTLHPFLKLRDGLALVDTPYCSICADDDLVLLPAVHECLALLERHAEACAAHGVYFNFSAAETFDLSYIVYRGPSLLADDPMLRLKAMFASYEAVTYAVYRTPVLQTVFARVGELETLLAREIVTAALAAVSGPIVRIDEFYYARNTAESLSYENWHPHQILAEEPALLFREYRLLREIVLEELSKVRRAGAGSDAGTVLDLVFLRYLAPFLRPDVLDLIIGDRLSGLGARSTVDHLWNVFVRCPPVDRLWNVFVLRPSRAQHPVEPLMTEGGEDFTPLRFREGQTRKDYLFRVDAVSGGPRTYKVFHEFVFPELTPPAAVGGKKLWALLDQLNRY